MMKQSDGFPMIFPHFSGKWSYNQLLLNNHAYLILSYFVFFSFSTVIMFGNEEMVGDVRSNICYSW